MPQSLSNVLIHVVFSTKGRIPAIPNPEGLHAYLAAVIRAQGCRPIRVGGTKDHVHALLTLSRTLTIAQLVEHLKTGSSKWLKGSAPGFSWQGGYGAFSVGPRDIESVVRYIQNQAAHHRKVDFQSEFRGLMVEAGIEIDERHVWD